MQRRDPGDVMLASPRAHDPKMGSPGGEARDQEGILGIGRRKDVRRDPESGPIPLVLVTADAPRRTRTPATPSDLQTSEPCHDEELVARVGTHRSSGAIG